MASERREYLREDQCARLAEAMKKKGLTTRSAGEILGVTSPSVSRILHGEIRSVRSDGLKRLLKELELSMEVFQQQTELQPLLDDAFVASAQEALARELRRMDISAAQARGRTIEAMVGIRVIGGSDARDEYRRVFSLGRLPRRPVKPVSDIAEDR